MPDALYENVQVHVPLAVWTAIVQQAASEPASEPAVVHLHEWWPARCV